MDELRCALINDSRRPVKIDVFYEHFKVPKFFDFTAPDHSRPDDSSWFCARIGCDQQHEQVDPDALQRSFKLRVMAARSPSFRLQKALNRDNTRPIPKYANSAPAKPARDRITRLNNIKSNPDKSVNMKLKDQSVSSLTSTPNCTKAELQSLTSQKALTALRGKKCSSDQELFRSVKHLKAAVAVLKNRSVAKALVFETPRMMAKKPSINSQKKKLARQAACDPRCPIMGSNKGEESARSSKKKGQCPTMLQERASNCSSYAEIDGKLRILAISATNVEELTPSLESNSKESMNSLVVNSTSSTIPNSQTSYDDKKENVSENDNTRCMNSNTTSSQAESLQFKSRDNLNLLPKAPKAPSKNFPENHGKGGNYRNITKPKPFRLRTNERGTWKEENLERKLHIEAHKKTTSALRCKDRVPESQIGKKMNKSQPDNQIVKRMNNPNDAKKETGLALRCRDGVRTEAKKENALAIRWRDGAMNEGRKEIAPILRCRDTIKNEAKKENGPALRFRDEVRDNQIGKRMNKPHSNEATKETVLALRWRYGNEAQKEIAPTLRCKDGLKDNQIGKGMNKFHSNKAKKETVPASSCIDGFMNKAQREIVSTLRVKLEVRDNENAKRMGKSMLNTTHKETSTSMRCKHGVPDNQTGKKIEKSQPVRNHQFLSI